MALSPVQHRAGRRAVASPAGSCPPPATSPKGPSAPRAGVHDARNRCSRSRNECSRCPERAFRMDRNQCSGWTGGRTPSPRARANLRGRNLISACPRISMSAALCRFSVMLPCLPVPHASVTDSGYRRARSRNCKANSRIAVGSVPSSRYRKNRLSSHFCRAGTPSSGVIRSTSIIALGVSPSTTTRTTCRGSLRTKLRRCGTTT